jgi:hypothetical protein
MVHAQTIDEVLGQLDVIIARSRARGSAEGYFAVLYRQVTAEVQRRIRAGFFEDGPRMERLDVVFANRYLVAAETFEQGGNPGVCWGLALRQSRAWRPLVIQHLLLGMNAHINLDLGIAAAEVVPDAGIQALETDFNRINEVLAGLVDEVQRRLATVWPALRAIDGFAGGVDEAVANFSMRKAREHAWSVAQRLAPIYDAAAREQAIRQVDADASAIAQLVLHPPGIATKLALLWIRLRERGSVADKIAALGG